MTDFESMTSVIVEEFLGVDQRPEQVFVALAL